MPTQTNQLQGADLSDDDKRALLKMLLLGVGIFAVWALVINKLAK